jgi:cytochrome c biogenesis protein CcmG/thiol:disulfide interchange protein DsbE
MRDALQNIDRMKGFLLALGLVLLCGTSVQAEDSLDLSEYRGKVVLLDFWASWCVPCRRSFPWMNEMQQKYGDSGLVIIGVNMDAEPEAAQGFLDDYPAKFRIISAPDGVLAKEYGVIAMPSSFVIGRAGEVVIKHLGFKVKKQDEYEADLVNVLRTGTE